MTRVRHQVMTNEGTRWLRDRRWAVEYLTKYLTLDDLHRWAVTRTGAVVPLGTGRLDSQLVVVTRKPLTEDERKVLDEGLAGVNYYLTVFSKTNDDELDATLLHKEIEIINPATVLSFGVSLTVKDDTKVIYVDDPITPEQLSSVRDSLSTGQ